MRAGQLKHRGRFQKLDQSSGQDDWTDWGAASVPCFVTDLGDNAGQRQYRVELRWFDDARLLTGTQDLGYAFLFLWTDAPGGPRELGIDRVTLPTEKYWKNPVLLDCTEVELPG